MCEKIVIKTGQIKKRENSPNKLEVTGNGSTCLYYLFMFLPQGGSIVLKARVTHFVITGSNI